LLLALYKSPTRVTPITDAQKPEINGVRWLLRELSQRGVTFPAL